MYNELKPPGYLQFVWLDAHYNINTNIRIGGKLVYEWGDFYGNNGGVQCMIGYV